MIKRFLIILILIFNLSNLSFADDIRDFQIEGISIGDSALDYFDKQEINKNIDTGSLVIYPSSDKYYGMTFDHKDFFLLYESVKIHLKKNDKKFTIVGVNGMILYPDPNNFDDCLKVKKKISKQIKEDFNFTKSDNYTDNFGGKGGESIAYISDFDFSSGGSIRVWCSKWDQENENTKRWKNSLNIGASSKVLLDFLKNDAYK